MPHNFNFGHREHLFAEYTIVRLVEDNPLDASLDDHLGAKLAWEGSGVDCGPHSPVSSSLHNC